MDGIMDDLMDRIKDISKTVDNYKITAIVSTYNSEKHIGNCIGGLLQQSINKQVEIIVIDSGSEQNEKEIVQEIQNKHLNIKYIRTEHETVYAAWNRAIHQALGEYLVIANTDDKFEPFALEKMSKCLDENPFIGLVYGDCWIVDENNSIIGEHNWPEYDLLELKKRCFIGPQPMWRKRNHWKTGYFNEKYEVAGDYDMWLRMGRYFYFKHIPEKIGYYYQNPDGLEMRDNQRAEQESNEVRERYKNPVVSVIIPHLPEKPLLCMDGISNQTFKDYEGIIQIDRGHRGAAWARNEGYKGATGKYLFFCDDDVLLRPDCFEIMVNILNTCPEAFVYCDYERRGAIYDTYKSIFWDSDRLLYGNYISTMSMMRREIFPGFDEEFKKLDDWDLWFRIMCAGHKGIYISQVLFTAVYQSGDVSMKSFDEEINWTVKFWKKQHKLLSENRMQELIKRNPEMSRVING